MTAPDDLTSTRAAIEAAERAFSGDIRCSRSGGQTCAKCNDGAECSVCYTQRHGRVLLAEVRRLTDPNMADRLRDLAADLSPFGCRPTMDAVKVLDYARVAIFDLIRERDGALIEVSRLTDANQRLTDLVRHQRGALHTEGLITDAEYAALAGLTGSPARLEGYDALRGELALQKRATNVAIGERGALQAIRAYLDAVVTQPGRDDFPEWHALADEDRDRLQAWGDRVCQAGMDAENEATEEAEDAARHAAEQADILLTTIRLALGDNPAGNGWKPPTGVHPVVDLALKVSEERDGAVAALATARLDGARVMRDDIADRLADSDIAPFALVTEIRAIDPAAVVGSGS